MKVLVLGGTGVISSAIVDRLNEKNHEVSVFNRGLRPVRYKQAVNAIQGDKKQIEEFQSEMKKHQFDAVIDMISYNSEDAKITLEAFAGQDIHFVFTSTVATYKRPFRQVPVVESAPLFNTDIVPYGYYKALMEAYLNEKMEKGVKITIIRPALTYGIGSKNIGVFRNNYGIVKRLEEGKPMMVFGDGTVPFVITFAPDLAKAFEGILGQKQSFGQIYNGCCSDFRIWDDLYTEFGKIVGVEPKILHLSSEMMYMAAPDKFGHILEEKQYPGIYDNSKLMRDLPDLKWEYTLDKTLKGIYEWYQSDPEARHVDEELDRLEDSLVAKYYECEKILKT